MEVAYYLVPGMEKVPAIAESVSKEVARKQNKTHPAVEDESCFRIT